MAAGRATSARTIPVVDRDGSMEHVVKEILKFRLRRAGRPQVLVRWAGRDAPGDTWDPVEHLANCEEAIRDFERARGCTHTHTPSGAAAPPTTPGRFHRRPGTPDGLPGSIGGPPNHLLVAGGRKAAWLHRSSVPSVSFLARRGIVMDVPDGGAGSSEGGVMSPSWPGIKPGPGCT